MPQVQLADGQSYPSHKVDFDTVSEPWAEYRLDDGSTVKIKVAVTGIERVDPEEHGLGDEPIYNVSSQTLVRTADIPEELMADSSANSVRLDDEVERGVE